jgi:hypothetical protein
MREVRDGYLLRDSWRYCGDSCGDSYGDGLN